MRINFRESEPVENVVLGGGEAGKYIAWELAMLAQCPAPQAR
jgi:hypothetical protein